MINLSREEKESREYNPFSFSYEQIDTAEYIEELIGYLESLFKKIIKHNSNFVYQIKRDYSSFLFDKCIVFTFNFYGYSVSTSMRVEYLHSILNKDEEEKNKEFLKSVIIYRSIIKLIFKVFIND